MVAMYLSNKYNRYMENKFEPVKWVLGTIVGLFFVALAFRVIVPITQERPDKQRRNARIEETRALLQLLSEYGKARFVSRITDESRASN